jgi:hypothetical protein
MVCPSTIKSALSPRSDYGNVSGTGACRRQRRSVDLTKSSPGNGHSRSYASHPASVPPPARGLLVEVLNSSWPARTTGYRVAVQRARTCVTKDSEMSEATKKEAKRQFSVSFRCESRVVVPAGQFHATPAFQTDFGVMQFGVSPAVTGSGSDN